MVGQRYPHLSHPLSHRSHTPNPSFTPTCCCWCLLPQVGPPPSVPLPHCYWRALPLFGQCLITHAWILTLGIQRWQPQLNPYRWLKVGETNGNYGFQMVIYLFFVVVPQGHLAMSRDVLGRVLAPGTYWRKGKAWSTYIRMCRAACNNRFFILKMPRVLSGGPEVILLQGERQGRPHEASTQDSLWANIEYRKLWGCWKHCPKGHWMLLAESYSWDKTAPFRCLACISSCLDHYGEYTFEIR